MCRELCGCPAETEAADRAGSEVAPCGGSSMSELPGCRRAWKAPELHTDPVLSEVLRGAPRTGGALSSSSSFSTLTTPLLLQPPPSFRCFPAHSILIPTCEPCFHKPESFLPFLAFMVFELFLIFHYLSPRLPLPRRPLYTCSETFPSSELILSFKATPLRI